MRTLHALSLSCVLAALLPSTPSLAQPAPLAKPVADAMTQKARQLYAEGVKAYQQSRWADARASFLAAWALSKHYTIAGNLGDCELRLGMHRDAAEHLERYAREIEKDGTSTAQERKAGQARYAEARGKVGEVNLEVSVAGAEVYVDGKLAGTAPLEAPVFLEAGSHTIEARSELFPTARKTVEARAGAAEAVVLVLRRAVEGAPPPLPTSRGPNKAIVLSGVVIAGAGVGLGVVFTVVSSVKASDAVAKFNALVKAGGPEACRSGAPAPGCGDLTDVKKERAALADAALWSFVGGGVVGAGTLIYALAAPKASVQALPVVTGQGGGITVRGSF
jgi:hypothetical protein